MKYSAINIGPIVKTLMMARKPRELWAASYLFSFLMKCIIEQLNEKDIVSPCVQGADRTDVGLYPDRVYIRNEVDDSVVKNAQELFSKALRLDKKTVEEYFSVMLVHADADSDAEAIIVLNQKLNVLELFERAIASNHEERILNLLKLKYDSPLFEIAYGKSDFEIKELQEIARNERKGERLSYNKYFCVVQADGDNMGQSITSAPDDKLKQISASLLDFGCNAVDAIKNYASYSLPIYAGGDDLLFIVPVVGNDGKNIFDLIAELDSCYERVRQVAGEQTTLSYGISISYYKYPLYECFETARNLLNAKAKKYEQKNVQAKNAIAWSLRKHSGGTFEGIISKNSDSYDAFKELLKYTVGGKVVSAVAHKIKANESLLQLWNGNENFKERNKNFFSTFIDMREDRSYKEAVRNLLDTMMSPATGIGTDEIVKTMYGMLRTAKFVKGEKDHE